MNLYKEMFNIRGLNKEEEIKLAIKEVKDTYKNLTIKRTCVIYSSLVAEVLNKLHVPVRIINTKNLGYFFEHQFCLVPSDDVNNYFLIDLTYAQFNTNDILPSLLSDGYILINDMDFESYLNVVTKYEEAKNVSLSKAFYQDGKGLR